MKTITLLLSICSFLALPCFASSLERNLNFRTNSEVTSKNGAWVYSPVKLGSGEIVLKPALKLEKGHRLSFRPSAVFQGANYLKEDGSKKVIRGRYFGSLLIEESGVDSETLRRIRVLNDQKIFIWEWRVDKSDYIIQAFNDLPRSSRHTPNSQFKWDSVNPDRAWTSYASSVINANRKTFFSNKIKDMNEFCPGITSKSREEKTTFWLLLMNALSYKESKFDPMVTNNEGHFGNGSLNVTSRGLFQMSFNSARAARYRKNGCELRVAENLHDPYKNIDCALAIFKTWLDKDNCISCKNGEGKARGVARYWSPLRAPYEVPCSVCSSGKAKIGFKDKIIKELSEYPVCSGR